MLSLFRKKKTHSSTKENAEQERLAKSVVFACIRSQQRLADYMQHHTERLSRNGKLIILSLFCLVAGSLSVYLIAGSMISRKASSFDVIHLKRPLYAVKSEKKSTHALTIVSKAEYKKIQRFRLYMDSLTRTPSGKKHHDSILSQRPGLMDSILLIENIYQSQIKR